jgi:hypothetical protein
VLLTVNKNVNWVALTNVVAPATVPAGAGVRPFAEPAMLTYAPASKPVPFTVTVVVLLVADGLYAMAVGLNVVTLGPVTVTDTVVDVAEPPSGLVTDTK